MKFYWNLRNKEDKYGQVSHLLFTVIVDLAQIVTGWK